MRHHKRIQLFLLLMVSTAFAQPGNYPQWWDNQELAPYTYLVKYMFTIPASGAVDSVGVGKVCKSYPPAITLTSVPIMLTVNYQSKYKIDDQITFRIEDAILLHQRYVVREREVICKYDTTLQPIPTQGFGSIDGWKLSEPKHMKLPEKEFPTGETDAR